MHSAFNLFVFPNSMFTPLLLLFFLYMKGYERSGEIALKNNNNYYYIYAIIFNALYSMTNSLAILV